MFTDNSLLTVVCVYAVKHASALDTSGFVGFSSFVSQKSWRTRQGLLASYTRR